MTTLQEIGNKTYYTKDEALIRMMALGVKWIAEKMQAT